MLDIMENRLNEQFARFKSYKPIIPIIIDGDNQWDEIFRYNDEMAFFEEPVNDFQKLRNYLENFW